MITESDVDRLLAIHTDHRDVLSLYLRVPADPAELRELPARAHGMLTLAAGSGGAPGGPGDSPWARPDSTPWPEQDEQQARELLQIHGREWLGHTAAIFVADQAGVAEAHALPCRLPDRAVLADRPHVRPLLVARQRCPVHYVVVLDSRHGWLFRVIGDRVEAAATEEVDAARQPRSAGFSGWHGFDAHRINDTIIELRREHLQAVIAMIERAPDWPDGAGPGGAGPGGAGVPFVVGGHEQTIARFSDMLPVALRGRLAGTFVVDPHTMTPAIVRDRAAPVIADWVAIGEQRRTLELREGEWTHDPLIATGLNRCLDAVNARAVDVLVVPVGGVTGGYVCEHCGALGSAVTGCPDGPAEARWVPDLFEEMVVRTIADGGRAEALTEPPGDVAACLRFPVPHNTGR